jgi:hypothetical protein
MGLNSEKFYEVALTPFIADGSPVVVSTGRKMRQGSPR